MNILLVQLKRIGDLILTTPAIAAVRKAFPEANVTLVVSDECAALLPAIVGIDHFLIMRRNLSDLGGFSSVLRQKFDYCIDFTRNDRSAFLSLLSRAKKRVVSYRVKRRAPIRGRCYNQFVEHRMRDMHTVDYNMSLVEPVGVRTEPPPLQLDLGAEAREKANLLRRPAGVDRPYIVFHPGSARPEKFWEADRWAEVIAHALTHWQVNAVLTGGASRLEKAHLAEIEAKLPRPVESSPSGSIIDLSGKMDLLTLAAMIAGARLLVTVDSAPMHLAAASATPQVVLFGPTNPFHWRPRQSPTLILQGESGRPMLEFASKQARLPMKLISTQAVIDAMNALLSSPTE